MPSKTLPSKPVATTSAPPSLPVGVTDLDPKLRWVLLTTITERAHVLIGRTGEIMTHDAPVAAPEASGDVLPWWWGEGYLGGKVLIIGLEGPFYVTDLTLPYEQRLALLRLVHTLLTTYAIPCAAMTERGGVGSIRALGVHDALIDLVLDMPKFLAALGAERGEEDTPSAPEAESEVSPPSLVGEDHE